MLCFINTLQRCHTIKNTWTSCGSKLNTYGLWLLDISNSYRNITAMHYWCSVAFHCLKLSTPLPPSFCAAPFAQRLSSLIKPWLTVHTVLTITELVLAMLRLRVEHCAVRDQPHSQDSSPLGISAASHPCQRTSAWSGLTGGHCGTARATHQIDTPGRHSTGKIRDEAHSKWREGKGRHLFSLKSLEPAWMGWATGCWLRLGGQGWKKPSLAQPRGEGGVHTSVSFPACSPGGTSRSPGTVSCCTSAGLSNIRYLEFSWTNSHPSSLFCFGNLRHLPCSLPGHLGHSLLPSSLALCPMSPACCIRHACCPRAVPTHVPGCFWGSSTQKTWRLSGCHFISNSSLWLSLPPPFILLKMEFSRSKNLGGGEEDLERKKQNHYSWETALETY